MDVGSSQTAARVVGIVQGALKGLVIDIAVLLEGKTKVTEIFCLITSVPLLVDRQILPTLAFTCEL